MNTTLSLIKEWIAKTGLEGFLGLGIAAVLLVLGFKFAAGISAGFFVSKNWDIIKNYVVGLIKKNKEVTTEEVKEVKEETK